MDIIYGISIFTHLSEEMHFVWFKELIRVLKKGGILFLTLHGDAFTNKLTTTEKREYNKGNLVIKGSSKDGHRTFAAFQPPSFVKKLVGNNQIVEHVKGNIIDGKTEQDIWIIKKQ